MRLQMELGVRQCAPIKPVGDHGAIYEQLHKKCKEIAASSGGVGGLLNDMLALADKLPGKVDRPRED